MSKDWTGNKKTTFTTLGASNHTDHERAEHDYYATEPKAVDFLLEVEKFNGTVWENCCVDAETEYFNGTIWKPISDYIEGEKVLVYDGEYGYMSTPLKYHKNKTQEPFYYWNGTSLNMMLTRDHRVVYLHRRKNKLCIDTAENIFKSFESDSNGFRGKIPTTFKMHNTINLNEWELRLAVACNADGRTRTKNKNTYQIRIKKQRKIDRLKLLLDKCGISYKYKEYMGYGDFVFESPLGCKHFPIEWLYLEDSLKRAIIDEVTYWDGSIDKHNNKFYYSNKKEDIDIIQMIAHSIGIGTNIYEDIRQNKVTNYCIAFKTKTTHSLPKKTKQQQLSKVSSKDGYSYCFSVDTGMLILRRKNKIFITGNCGEGHLSKRMIELGLDVISTDLIDRGYGEGNKDFFKCTETLGDNIITNPPYAFAQEWVEHSLKLLHNGNKLALFLPIQFLESDSRKQLFKTTPPARIHVFSNRILCGINGDFYQHNKDGSLVYDKNGSPKRMSSAKCYAWFVWEVGNYDNKPTVDWIN